LPLGAPSAMSAERRRRFSKVRSTQSCLDALILDERENRSPRAPSPGLLAAGE
jgi:hypothetical protein